MHINRTTLPNGLRLVHSEDTTTQMVCVNLLYQVGSRNEHPERTGFAHLFEHLMFGGTRRVPNFDIVLQDACGDNNAFTSEDITNYYITLPAQHLETAVMLESDRMAGLAFTPHSLDVQRKVVMEEFKLTCLNQPYGDLSHLLFRLAYKDEPYEWPTIGKRLSHIAQATMPQVKDFFRRYYRPENAILCLVGNVSWERAQELVNQYWGTQFRAFGAKAAAQPASPVMLRDELSSYRWQRAKGLRRRTYRRQVPSDLVVMAFRIPSRGDDRFQPCDMLSDVLANGRSSRLYRSLVQEQHLCDSIDAYVSGRIGDGLLIIEAMPLDGISPSVVEQAIWTHLDALRTTLVPDEELQKVKNKYETNTHLLLSDYMQRAEQLAYFEMFGDAHLLLADLPRYLSITSQELRHMARQVLPRRNACVIHYLADPQDDES